MVTRRTTEEFPNITRSQPFFFLFCFFNYHEQVIIIVVVVGGEVVEEELHWTIDDALIPGTLQQKKTRKEEIGHGKYK